MMHFRRAFSSIRPSQSEIRDLLRSSQVRQLVRQELQLNRRAIRHLTQLFCCGRDLDFADEAAVVSAFVSFARQFGKDNDVVDLTDLRSPSQWYPLARSMKRDIILHCGPTNSGKTHNALKKLEASSSGAYAGPLRLLAWEVHARLNRNRVACDLITGQEIIEIDGAQHRSSTVEMTNVARPIDCAVIDEIQMIGDVNRGHAWTRALLGVPAQTVFLCGDESAVELIEEICDVNGDSLSVVKHERLGELRFVSPIRSLKELSPGDCLIAFSRNDILSLKVQVERMTGRKACVIYGNLPPATRQTQAALFNDPDSGYDILIASDAIGMGLNLSIKRVIFSSIQKFDGKEVRRLTRSEILQIGGRAGRFNSQYPNGSVTCLMTNNRQRFDAEYLRKALQLRPDPIDQASLSPEFDAIQRFSDAKPYMHYHEVLRQFQRHSTLDGLFFMSDVIDDQAFIAEALQELPLTLSQKHTFSMAPVSVRCRQEMRHLLRLAKQFCETRQSDLVFHSREQAVLDRTCEDRLSLSSLELLSSLTDVYIWLGNRYPMEFRDLERAQVIRDRLTELINTALETIGDSRRYHRKIAL